MVGGKALAHRITIHLPHPRGRVPWFGKPNGVELEKIGFPPPSQRLRRSATSKRSGTRQGSNTVEDPVR